MKSSKVVLFAATLTAVFVKPNQAAPSKATATSQIAVFGQVRKPGFYRFSGQHLLDAIVTTGGMTQKPASLSISVQRGGKRLPVNVHGLLALDGKQNFALQSGDVFLIFDKSFAGRPLPPGLLPLPSQPKPLANRKQFQFNGESVRIVPLSKNHPQ